MESPLKVIDNQSDFELFRSLLKSSSLPVDDLDYRRDLLVGYFEDDAMVGTGALEVYGGFGLLRSLSVKLGTRGKALGTAITEYLVSQAKERQLKGIYLLTENARGFFQRKGFVDVKRDAVPDALHASSEFSGAHRASANAMQLSL